MGVKNGHSETSRAEGTTRGVSVVNVKSCLQEQPPSTTPAYYADLWPSIPIFRSVVCWAASALRRRESRSRRWPRLLPHPSAVCGWAAAFWKPALPLLFGQFESRSLASIGWFPFCPPLALRQPMAAKCGRFWMSQPPPHRVCGRWSRCLSPESGFEEAPCQLKRSPLFSDAFKI